jgi:hypothetical protein
MPIERKKEFKKQSGQAGLLRSHANMLISWILSDSVGSFYE